MSLRSDHKALIFVGVVAVLGAGVRVVRAAGSESGSRVQPALDVQARAADSAASAHRDGRNGQGRGRGKGQGRGRSGRGSSDTTRKIASPSRSGPLDRAGYVGGKLDLDVATASQIDSLPGVASGMAKRIVADRMMRGPFLSRDGLTRVSGVGPLFLRQIDSLVVFSGTFVAPATSDTVISRQKSKRPKASTRPAVQRTTVRRRVPSLRAASGSCSPAPGSAASPRRVT
jgi:hypothetical protein